MGRINSPRTDTIDRAGVVASAICAVHCAVCALLPGLIAVLGLTVVLGETAEWTLNAAAILIGGSALMIGWRRHRSPLIMLALTIGMAGLVLARYLEESGRHEAGAVLGVLSSLTLVAGHVWGIRAAQT